MLVGRVGWASLLTLIGVLAVPRLGAAAEFSADVVITQTRSGGQSATMTGKIYVKGKNARMELAEGKGKRVRIVNADKKMLWLLDTAKKTYVGAPATAEIINMTMDQLRGKLPPSASKDVKVKRLGTETVNGYPCEKTLTQAKNSTVTTWYSRKLDIAVKIDAKDAQGQQLHQEAKNIKMGPQPASLFLVPKGYKEVKPPQGAGATGGPGGRRGPGAMRRPPTGRR